MNEEVILLATRLETRTRQMLLHYSKLQQKLSDAESKMTELKEYISALEDENQELKDKYEHLKMAKYIDMADDDMNSTRKRINSMLRSVEKCISIVKAED